VPAKIKRDLPDVSRLLLLDRRRWRFLGLRLREIGVTSDYLHNITHTSRSFPHAMRAPLERWHSMRLTKPAGDAVRLLTLGNHISDDAAAAALGQRLLADLLDAGLILQDDNRLLFSPFSLRLVMNQLYVICDEPAYRGDAVMGVSETTGALFHAANQTRHLERVLDLGCGAGTVALLLARNSTKVIGTDINSRAIILSQVNAAINGIDNVEFRDGDKFAPVISETFDLIVSQPPFVAQPKGVSPATYLYGGPRGDELALQILSELEPYLSPTGRAVLVVQWPDDGQPIGERVRTAAGTDRLNILLLCLPPADVDDLCTQYAAGEHFELDKDFESLAIQRREHLDQLGIRGARTTYTVLERVESVSGWTVVRDLTPENSSYVSGARIDTLLATRNLLHKGTDTLRKATLRVPAGAVLAEERQVAAPANCRLVLRLPPQTLARSVKLSEHLWKLLSIINEAEDVNIAIDRFAVGHGLSFQEALEEILPVIEHAMKLGILEPAQTYENPNATARLAGR